MIREWQRHQPARRPPLHAADHHSVVQRRTGRCGDHEGLVPIGLSQRAQPAGRVEDGSRRMPVQQLGPARIADRVFDDLYGHRLALRVLELPVADVVELYTRRSSSSVAYATRARWLSGPSIRHPSPDGTSVISLPIPPPPIDLARQRHPQARLAREDRPDGEAVRRRPRARGGRPGSRDA